MSRTERRLPTHNGRTFPMRGRTRATFIAHRVQHAAAAALAYGFFWDTIPDAERRAVRQARWDAHLEALAAWEAVKHQPRIVSTPFWGPEADDHVWRTAVVFPPRPERPCLHIPKRRRVSVEDVDAVALYLEGISQDAALFWDRTHRDGGIDRCGRKDRSNAPSRKTQRAQARQRCHEATLDEDVVDNGRWQDMLGMAEVFPRKW